MEERVTEAKRKMENKRDIPTSLIKKSVESWEREIQDLHKKYVSICAKLETTRHQLEEIEKVYEGEIQDIELDLGENGNSGPVRSDREMLSGDSEMDNNDDEVSFY